MLILILPFFFFCSRPVLPGAAAGDFNNGGHGTPVAGAIAGSMGDFATPEEKAFAKMHEGVAPNAKLVVDDMSDESEVGSLKVPGDLNERLFPFSYSAGARIYANAWGDDSTTYTSSSEEVDRFSHQHDDFLILFAAGNTGEKAYSVSSPGTAKNAITVGAVDNSRYAAWDYGFSAKLGLYLKIEEGAKDVRGLFVQVLPAEFGPNITVQNDRLFASIVLAEPLNACEPLTNGVAMRGKIALALRGSCPFQNKVNHLQNSGAVLVLVYNDDQSQSTPIMQRSSTLQDPKISAFSISWRDGEFLKTAMESSGNLSVSLIHVYSQDIPKEYLATYSSRGPAPGQRFKPDILCPGTLLRTASSDGSLLTNQCAPRMGDSKSSLMEGTGTSFAVGVCAGAAALVRQYIRRSYNLQSPPAALIKAMLLHSGQPVMYNSTTKEGEAPEFTLPQSMPHFSQGYGMINLSSVLISGSPSAYPWKDVGAIVDRSPINAFCFSISPSAPAGGRVRATLTWTDIPAREGSNYPIVNDLDLSVVGPQVRYYICYYACMYACNYARPGTLYMFDSMYAYVCVYI